MKVEINERLYSIDREKYSEERRSFIITVDNQNINYIKEWFEITKCKYAEVNLWLYRNTGIDHSPFAKLTNCYVYEITYKPWEGDAFKVEIVYSEYIEHKTPEKINIELHSIQVPENKNLIRTEMEKGVLFTYEDKISPNKKVPENDYNSEYWKKEIIKCREDIVYFIEKYLTIFDNISGVNKPFILTNNQKIVLRGKEEHSFNLIKTYRQSGLTVLYAAKTTHKLLFEENVKVAYCGVNGCLNEMFMSLVRDFITEAKNQLPLYGLHYLKNNKNEILLRNENNVVAFILEREMVLPYYLYKIVTDLIVDDAEFNKLTVPYYNYIKSVSKSLKNTTISSVKGILQGGYFTDFWEKGTDYCENRIELNWFEDERYNKDLKWYPIKYVENNIEKTAYIPGNEWYSNMSKVLGENSKFEIGVGFNPYKTNKEDNNKITNIKWV